MKLVRAEKPPELLLLCTSDCLYCASSWPCCTVYTFFGYQNFAVLDFNHSGVKAPSGTGSGNATGVKFSQIKHGAALCGRPGE